MDPALATAALAALESAANRALDFDPATRDALAELDGRVFHIELTSPDIDIYLLPTVDGIALRSVHEGIVDTHVRGNISDFVELLAASDAPSALINGEIRLTGDSAPLLRLQAILHELDCDLEAPLARLIGDVPAHEIGQLARRSRRGAAHALRSLARQGREYVVEEAELVVPRPRVEALLDEIDEVAAATDRLAARLERLRARIARQRGG